jgi:cytochrome c556
MKRAMVIAIGAVLLLQGGAFAHEGEMHGHGHQADAQMQKLHAMMPMFAVEQSKVETALEKGDRAAVETGAGKMLAAVPDLKKSKPHKNLKHIKLFKSTAARFEHDLTDTVRLANKSDFAGAKVAFKNAEAKCAECHAKFRD